MTAYIIGELNVHNPERYADYTAHTPKTIADHGGKFIVRGGDPKSLEGGNCAPRFVVVEFPSMEKLMEWYNSDAYQAIIPIRQEAADGRIVAVQGADTIPLV